ncbi:CBS domain-containing protein [Proteinivorax hydrogeniformans]|uniref:CBS domain-containing protein n=1 Tax=Proteinivorax hydrogeniformans TaxID=1826727 RepID=A0AAU8HT44_9FIRM
MKVAEVMNKDVVSINKNATVEEATKLMIEKSVGGLPVVDDENKVVGMITEKDLLLRHKEFVPPPYVDILGAFVYLEDPTRANERLKKSLSASVEDVMSTPVFTVSPEDDTQLVLQFIVDHGYNRIPVEEEEKLVGIVSRGDILKGLV